MKTLAFVSVPGQFSWGPVQTDDLVEQLVASQCSA